MDVTSGARVQGPLFAANVDSTGHPGTGGRASTADAPHLAVRRGAVPRGRRRGHVPRNAGRSNSGTTSSRRRCSLARRPCEARAPPRSPRSCGASCSPTTLVRLEMERVRRGRPAWSPPALASSPPTTSSATSWLWCAVASPGAIPKHLHDLRKKLARLVLPVRRPRSYPRLVKVKVQLLQREPSQNGPEASP